MCAAHQDDDKMKETESHHTALKEIAPTETSLKLFLGKNPNIKLVKAGRDAHSGIWKLIDAAIFGFLLFSPALPIIPEMEMPAIVATLWILISLIMWCKIEYCNRAELWYACLYRGIILDFPKTNKLKGWLCAPPMMFAYSFLLIFGAVLYVGLDPDFEFDSHENALQAILSVVGVIFILLLTKSFVNLEGAPALLTLNMVIAVFENPEFLKAQGFKVVQFADLQHFMERKRASKDKTFHWDELHALGGSDASASKAISLIGGTRVLMSLRKFFDVGDEATE